MHPAAELRELTARMAKILPAPAESRARYAPRIQDRPLWRMTVIEAKPIKLEVLQNLPTCWQFRGDIPPLFQDPATRRWYAEERTRTSTSDGLAEAFDDGRVWLPLGMSLWHASDESRRLTVLAKHDARMFFTQRVQDVGNALTCENNWQEAGVCTLFPDLVGTPERLCFRDCMHLIRTDAPYLARLAEEYAKSLCWMYDIDYSAFEEGCRFSMRWLSSERCQPMTLPPASESWLENGPIVHVGIGLPVICLDLAPCIPADPTESRKEVPVRVSVPEGVLVCMDGASRIRYSQGFPARVDTKEPWLAMSFFMDCSKRSTPIAYERETRTVVMHTPIIPERVVTTQRLEPEEMTRMARVGTRDSMAEALFSLRRLLRSAESYTILQRATGEEAFHRCLSISDGSIGMQEKSSSSRVEE